MDGRFSLSIFRKNLSRQEDLRDTKYALLKRLRKELKVTTDEIQHPTDHRHSKSLSLTHTQALTLPSILILNAISQASLAT